MDQSQLQALLEKQLGQRDIYNLVAGVRSQAGHIDLTAGAGVANPDTGTAMTAETPYFLASISKMYTAAVIIKLHQHGLLSLDDAISKLLPATLIAGIHVYKGTDYSAQIRVYQLLNQTSGLADYFEGKPVGGTSLFEDLTHGQDRAMDIEQVVAITRGLTPRFEPGAKQGRQAFYSDTNFQLLGAIIEAATGKSVTENFQALIFDPLSLERTFVYDAATLTAEQTPAVFYLKDRVVNIPQFLSTNVPDGGVVATVADSLTFLQAFFDGKLFDVKFFERMRRWNSIFFPMQYGYGMMRLNLPRIFSPFKPFPEFIGHSGSTGAFAYYCPTRALYVAGTINQIAAPSKAIQLMMRIANGVK
ncbi:MAG: beta-lactamase family protein [Anaerolineae bacterium]|nr:beta-lactamase family protein [Anaerolineae bacterium]